MTWWGIFSLTGTERRRGKALWDGAVCVEATWKLPFLSWMARGCTGFCAALCNDKTRLQSKNSSIFSVSLSACPINGFETTCATLPLLFYYFLTNYLTRQKKKKTWWNVTRWRTASTRGDLWEMTYASGYSLG